MLATVRYQIATYTGEISVNVPTSADDAEIIAKAKRVASARGIGFSGPCFESWHVVAREEGN